MRAQRSWQDQDEHSAGIATLAQLQASTRPASSAQQRAQAAERSRQAALDQQAAMLQVQAAQLATVWHAMQHGIPGMLPPYAQPSRPLTSQVSPACLLQAPGQMQQP